MIKDAFKRFMARKSFPGSNPGDFDDADSYMGNLRTTVIGLLAIYMSRYMDLWWQLVWFVRGEDHPIHVGKMQFHARVGFVMGLFGLVAATLLSYNIYRQQRRLRSYTTPRPSQDDLDAEIALRLKEQAELRKHQGLSPEPVPIPPSTLEQRLRELIWRIPILHDLIWGWPFLLALPLVFLGKTLDGSPNPGLIGIFTLPSLDFFVLGKTPASAMNGLFIGGIAYSINHAIAKFPRLPLAAKLLASILIGGSAVLAWYALTQAMGAPI